MRLLSYVLVALISYTVGLTIGFFVGLLGMYKTEPLYVDRTGEGIY